MRSGHADDGKERIFMKEILIVRHVEIEGPGMLGDFLRERGIPFRFLDAFVDEGAALREVDLGQVAAAVILGGPMNVYEEDRYPFLRIEKYLIREFLMRRIPLLGICLGAQLIACSLGARVRKAPQQEIGWFDLPLEATAREDLLMGRLPAPVKVFQWHDDAFEVPVNATLLARSNGINQAFRFRDIAWGLQFHLEIDRPMIESWCREYMDEGGSVHSCNRMVEQYGAAEALVKEQARLLCSAFLEKAGL